MLNNSISVLSRAAARFKKMVLVAEILIQLMFVGYYTYLLVVHRDDLILLIGYSVLTALGLAIFFVMVFTFDPYRKKVLELKKYIRRILRVVSWSGKIIVISYNVYTLIRFGMTETGNLLLVFSIIIFFTEVVLFVVSTIISYYYQLFIYALKMDYQRFLGDKEDITEKPIGRILLNLNDSTDYEDEVNSLFIEQEIYEEVKKYSEKEESEPINRHKIEKLILRYYNDTQNYYLDKDKLVALSESFEDIDKKELPHLYVLKFFLINGIEKVYYGLTEQYFRFVLSGLSIYLENKSIPVLEIIYQIIIKNLVGNTNWSKPLAPIPSAKKSIFSIFKGKEDRDNAPSSLSASMFNEINDIVKKSVEEKELELKKTVGGEIEGIVSTTIKKKVSGSIKSRIRNIFKKKK